MMSETQDARLFTVQIRHTSTDEVVGTGFIVSADGKIVTCAHVVKAAGVNLQPCGPIPGNLDEFLKNTERYQEGLAHDAGAEVGVCLPEILGNRKKAMWRATVVAYFCDYEDDVVLLQLVGDTHFRPEEVAKLGTAEFSGGHRFKSYGSCRLVKYTALWAEGDIKGCFGRPDGWALQTEPVQLDSKDLDKGFSGAAVFDTDRERVVAVVSEAYFPKGCSAKHRDTAFAVDARALTLNPFNLHITPDEDRRIEAVRPSHIGIEIERTDAASGLKVDWKHAPLPATEVDELRRNLLQDVSADWADPERRVTGLIGSSGDGKSSLARRWLDNLQTDESQPQPDGVFGWNFQFKPSADEFFEEALKYMSGGKLDPRDCPSVHAKTNHIMGMLYTRRYLLVLDGLEGLQHQRGDLYGQLKSGNLRKFLERFAAEEHQSFCLITSSVPVPDLFSYSAYTHRDVPPIDLSEGRSLLSRLGVKGSDEALYQVVRDWDGHTLALGLLGTYLANWHGSDVAKISEITPPRADEALDERVHRLLCRYDEHLEEAERAFMILFSAFRRPVEKTAFEKVFQADMGSDALNSSVAALGGAAFKDMVQRLIEYRILDHEPGTSIYTTSLLIRAHYRASLTACDQAQARVAHECVKDYYLDLAGATPPSPTLNDLAPLNEAVHHACQAGAYDEAFHIQRPHRSGGLNLTRYLVDLDAYETVLALMQEFLPGGDLKLEPQVSELEHKGWIKGWILNEIGLCLAYLGRPAEAVSFYERAAEKSVALGKKAGRAADKAAKAFNHDREVEALLSWRNETLVAAERWRDAGRTYFNMAELYAYLGRLATSANAAEKAVEMARHAQRRFEEHQECSPEARGKPLRGNGKFGQYQAMAYHAWALHLRGDLEEAERIFQQAEELQRDRELPSYLYSDRGILQADHLRRSGKATYALDVTKANLEISDRERYKSQCHRVLGDLDADAGHYDSARGHYDAALRIARGISHHPALIEALLARGRLIARHDDDIGAAFSDLREALEYATSGGYRIYEADIRIGLAWAHLAVRDPSAAQAQAEYARRISGQMDYHWGQVDSKEVLDQLS